MGMRLNMSSQPITSLTGLSILPDLRIYGVTATDHRNRNVVMQGLSTLLSASSDVVLKTSLIKYNDAGAADAEVNNYVAELAVEPLRRTYPPKSPSFSPCTFRNLVDSEGFNHFFTEKRGVFQFSDGFKIFIRSLIKYITELASAGIYIRVDKDNIILTAQLKLKIYDLCSVFVELRQSLASLKTTLLHLLLKAHKSRLKTAYEVRHFIVKAPTDETFCRHPALLDKGQKLQYILSLRKCAKWWSLDIDDDGLSPVHDWEKVISQYRYLKYVLWNGTQEATALSTGVSTGIRGFLHYVRHLSEHLNDVVAKEKGATPRISTAAPFSPHKYGEVSFTDTAIEEMVDYLFPAFASYMHRFRYYHFIDNRQ